MYKEKVFITSNDVDNHLNLKVSSIFKFMQMVSTNHSEKLHIGQKDTIDVGMAWVIIRMQVVIYDYPKLNDEIIVTTHPGEANRFLFPRFYQIYDKKGKLLIAGSTLWCVIDMNTRRVLLNPFKDRKFPVEKNKDDIALPEKVSKVEYEKVEDRKVRYNDIDMNGHLNNVKYIEYIIDMKNKDFYDNNQVKSILINYEKELKEGELVSLSTNGDNDFYVKGEKDDSVCFTSYVETEKRR